MESKYKQEMEEHKQRLDKEYDNLKQQFAVELEKLKKKQFQDLEKRVCIVATWCINVHCFKKNVNIAFSVHDMFLE